MTNWANQIYRLLPAVHQIRDGEQGEPLHAWLSLVGEQVQELQDDIEQLYDNWFIETSDDWVVPYIGDLVGFRRTSAAGEPADSVTARGQLLNRFLYPRREIANLVRRRRRKGTLSVLEDMAKDVSGWPARAVEFSRLVNFFQNVKHPQPTLGRTFSIRETATHPRVNTPFDKVAHTVDVRQIQNLPGIGWYHPRHLGLFVWRRKVFSATKVCACGVCKTITCDTSGKPQIVHYYTFNRIGTESPLAVRPVAEPDELHIADETNVPGLLYRHLLADKTSRVGDAYYGISDTVPKSLAIHAKWPGDTSAQLIPGPRVHVCNLTDAQRIAFARNLPARDVAVDPERGILLFGCKTPPVEVRVSYHHTAAMGLGGGEYERPIIDPPDFKTIRVRANGCCQGSGPPNLFELVHKTLEQTPAQRCSVRSSDSTVWLTRSNSGAPPCTDLCVATWLLHKNLCVELTESDTFCVPANERLQIAKNTTLVIRSALGTWPMLNVQPTDAHSCHLPWRILMEPGSRLVIDGLLIGGVTIEIADAGKPINPDSKDRASTLPCRPCDGAANSGALPKSPDSVEVHLRHSTLVPGGRPHSCANSVHASLTMKVSQAKLVIRHSIVGTLNVEHPQCAKSCGQPEQKPACPLDPLAIEITDSLVDAAPLLPAIYSNCCSPAHADLTIERSTILGDICVQQMSRAEDSLFAGIVHVQRRGVGYMRFCYVPLDSETAALIRHHHRCFENHRSDEQRRLLFDLDQRSPLSIGSSTFEQTQADQCFVIRTPPRFKCVPEPKPSADKPTCSTGCGSVATTPAETATTVLLPKFVSTTYGQPGYGELSLDCDWRILRGAEDESEVGVFHDLYRPQRDAALRGRLQEYTPAEMQSAVIYADDLHPATFATDSINQP